MVSHYYCPILKSILTKPICLIGALGSAFHLWDLAIFKAGSIKQSAVFTVPFDRSALTTLPDLSTSILITTNPDSLHFCAVFSKKVF